MVIPLKPRKGGFLRPFGCGWFIREFLAGHGPHDSPTIDATVGAPQSDIFHYYKIALMTAHALDRATRQEERQARQENRSIQPDKIDGLASVILARTPYKTTACRYHSFVVYFSNLRRLGWVEESHKEEPSAFQDNYPPAHPRRYYRLTAAGKAALDSAWANPQLALYR